MTSRVSFYALCTQSLLEALPKLLEKILGGQNRVLVVNENPLFLEELDRTLWTYSTRTFLPHGRQGAGFEDQQPLLLATDLTHALGRDVLVVTSPLATEITLATGLPHLVEMFDGTIAETFQEAKKRRVTYNALGLETTWWSQSTQGAWEQVA